MSNRVEVYEDKDGQFHYQVRVVGQKNAKHSPMLCGREPEGMRKGAWFMVDDARGRVHYERACDRCRGKLVS